MNFVGPDTGTTYGPRCATAGWSKEVRLSGGRVLGGDSTDACPSSSRRGAALQESHSSAAGCIRGARVIDWSGGRSAAVGSIFCGAGGTSRTGGR